MKIGVLNELLNDISCDMSLVANESGNPAKNEPVLFKWHIVRNAPFELSLKFEKSCFVDRVEVTLGKETNLTSITLCDEKDTLYTHRAETGKTISTKTVVLEAGRATDNLRLCFESDFSDIEILSVKLYGALFEEKGIFPTPDSISFDGKTVSPCTFDTYSADCDVTGKYILTYSDGSTEEIDITNNGNIGYWNRRQNEAVTHPMYRHTGYTSTYYSDSDEFKTADGQNVCIYKYEHILPEGKKLTNVKLVQSEKFDTDIFLLKLEGVK